MAQNAAPQLDDPYVQRFLHSPVYVMVLRSTIDTAASSYKVARILSIILFSLGGSLLVVSVAVGLIRNEQTLSLVFGGLGTANLIALLLYRPIERIQSGVDALIKSQIVCLSFMAQYDSIARTLATMSQLPLKETNRDEQLKLAQQLRESASQLIADLNQPRRFETSSKQDDKASKKS
jgi:hypothetical protein